MNDLGFTYVLSDSFPPPHQDDWAALLRPEGDPMMDLRLAAVVAATMPEQIRLWTLIVYDPQRRPVGIACLATFRVDACALMSPWMQRLSRGVRRLWDGYLRFHLMFVGVPISSGQSSLRIAADTDAPQVLAIIDKVAADLAKRHGCYAIMFYNLDEDAARRMSHLTALDYLQVDALAVNEFPARFRNYSEFCAALRSQYRRRIARSKRKFAASGLRAAWTTGAEGAAELYTNEVHRLYEAVLARAHSRLESLPAEFFRQLARQFAAQARFLFVYDSRQIVGFLSALSVGDVYIALFVGVDYAVNETTDLYFNMMFEFMDDALRRNAAHIVMGADADTFKLNSGCVQNRRYMFIRGRRLLHPLLRLGAKFIFPPVALIPPHNLYLRKVATAAGNGDNPEGTRHSESHSLPESDGS